MFDCITTPSPVLDAANQADALAKLFGQLKAKGTLIRGGGLRISIGTTAENQRTLTNIQQILHLTR